MAVLVECVVSLGGTVRCLKVVPSSADGWRRGYQFPGPTETCISSVISGVSPLLSLSVFCLCAAVWRSSGGGYQPRGPPDSGLSCLADSGRFRASDRHIRTPLPPQPGHHCVGHHGPAPQLNRRTPPTEPTRLAVQTDPTERLVNTVIDCFLQQVIRK